MLDNVLGERIGNLHLMLLHLPIGFVVAAVWLEFWRARRPSAEAEWLCGRLLAANAVATLLAAGAGLVLAEQGGYPADTLGWHRWAGVACAGLAVATWLAHAKGRAGWARGALGALVLATVVAGHQGATLTHGEAVTALWPGEKKTAERAPQAGVGVGVAAESGESVFVKSIQPLLERSCIECHGPERAKGRLRLDGRAAALAAGRSGLPAVVPGKPEASELLRRVKLPRDDPDAMPEGEDEPGLAAEEIAALEAWIAAGAAWR